MLQEWTMNNLDWIQWIPMYMFAEENENMKKIILMVTYDKNTDAYNIQEPL